jgi:hypothetical protein
MFAAKPIDLLAKYISAEEEVDAVEMHEPYTYLNGLTIKDLEDLIEDIKVSIKSYRGTKTTCCFGQQRTAYTMTVL